MNSSRSESSIACLAPSDSDYASVSPRRSAVDHSRIIVTPGICIYGQLREQLLREREIGN